MEYSNNLKQALKNSAELAYINGGSIDSTVLLFSILKIKCSATKFMSSIGFENADTYNLIQDAKYLGDSGKIIPINKSYKKVLSKAMSLANILSMSEINTSAVLLAVLFTDCAARNFIEKEFLPIVDILKSFYSYYGINQSVIDLLECEFEDFDEASDAQTKTVVPDNNDMTKSEADNLFESIRKLEETSLRQKQARQQTSNNNGGTNERTQASKATTKEEQESRSFLNTVGQDITELARKNKLDPLIGRQREVNAVIQVLSRRSKNNPVLIGEPGVGKTAIAYGLAQAIVDRDVPECLNGKTIFELDIASVVAGTKYRGEFEEKLQKFIKIVKASKNTIVFIDELHSIVGAGDTKESSLDAANILKGVLSRGELQIIGATTIDEYRLHVEKDKAFERRLTPIMVEPPTIADTITIIQGLKEKYELHHNVVITEEAINRAAVLSDKYIYDRYLPDKAIDLIDEACSRKKNQMFIPPKEIQQKERKLNDLYSELDNAKNALNSGRCFTLKEEIDELSEVIAKEREKWRQSIGGVPEITGEDIAERVSDKTNIPLTKITQSEGDRLLYLEKEISKRIVGQEDAINTLARAIRRARAGLKDPKRPIGSFIFLGPTGVGKTELCKALAEYMFGDERLMIRLDMSEYRDQTSVTKLTGSAPGYIGYEQGGQLTEKVRRRPYSVVLFDELEKAHPDVFNVLLQIMEEGRLTDSHGVEVNFKNTIVIMTSNIGAKEIINSSGLGFSENTIEANYEELKRRQMDALKTEMRPEFINRIDEVVIFHRLTRDNLLEIAKRLVADIAVRLKDRNIELNVDTTALEYFVDNGSDLEYGARPLRRALTKLLEDPLSDRILSNEISFGSCVMVKYVDGELKFEIGAVK